MFEQLDYIREEGRFKWNDKIHHNHKSKIGKYAGTINNHNILIIGIKGKLINAGRIVWFMEYGDFPSRVIYKDENSLNNHFSNLMTTGNRITPDGVLCYKCSKIKDINQFRRLSNKQYLCLSCEKKSKDEQRTIIRQQAKILYDKNREYKLKKQNERRRMNNEYKHAMRQLEEQQ